MDPGDEEFAARRGAAVAEPVVYEPGFAELCDRCAARLTAVGRTGEALRWRAEAVAVLRRVPAAGLLEYGWVLLALSRIEEAQGAAGESLALHRNWGRAAPGSGGPWAGVGVAGPGAGARG